MRSGVAEPASLVGEAQQRLHHRQRQQLGIGQLRGNADLGRHGARSGRSFSVSWIPRQCGREGVQIGVHRRPPRSTWGSNADHGRLRHRRRGPSSLGIVIWPRPTSAAAESSGHERGPPPAPAGWIAHVEVTWLAYVRSVVVGRGSRRSARDVAARPVDRRDQHEPASCVESRLKQASGVFCQRPVFDEARREIAAQDQAGPATPVRGRA